MKSIWNRHNIAWPFQNEPSSGRTVPTSAVCSVRGARIIRKTGCCSNFIQLNHIILVYHLQFPWQKFQKHNELTNITNNKFKPYTNLIQNTMYSLSQYNHHKYDSKLLVLSYFQCLKRPNNKLSDAKINRACENIRTKLRPKNNMTIPQTFSFFFS